jgi:hypothetical protein
LRPLRSEEETEIEKKKKKKKKLKVGHSKGKVTSVGETTFPLREEL